MRAQAAVLDLDGTLVDTLGDFTVALNRSMAEMGWPALAPEWVERAVGKGSEHLIRSVLAHQLSQEAVKGVGCACPALTVDAYYPRVWTAYQQHYRDINGQFAQAYPGVTEGLALLCNQGLRIACVTNKPVAFAQDLLDKLGLADAFAVVFGGDSFERKKPDPLPLLKACEALGSDPVNTLMVGDSVNDAQAANAAGLPLVLMTYGYNHGQDIRQTPALAWLDRLDQIEPCLALR
ncbi:MAG: Phosphoglycolate phosphatase [Pseudomonadota bacterium]|jgi:phosphoglycolate phosphatase